MGKESFVMHKDWRRALDKMDDAEVGKLLKAIYAYNFDGTQPEDLPPAADMVFLMAQSFFDGSAARYEEKCRKNKESGRSGGRPKKDDDDGDGEEDSSPDPTSENTNDVSQKKANGFFDGEKKANGFLKNRTVFSDVNVENKNAKKSERFFEKPNGFEKTQYEYEYEYDYTHSNECESARACAREDAHTPSPDIEGYILPQNVKMTAQEIKELASRFPDQWREMIDHLAEVMLRNKKTYPDHYRTILRWAKEDGISPGRKGEYYDSGQIVKSYDVDDFFEAAVNKQMRKGG